MMNKSICCTKKGKFDSKGVTYISAGSPSPAIRSTSTRNQAQLSISEDLPPSWFEGLNEQAEFKMSTDYTNEAVH